MYKWFYLTFSYKFFTAAEKSVTHYSKQFCSICHCELQIACVLCLYQQAHADLSCIAVHCNSSKFRRRHECCFHLGHFTVNDTAVSLEHVLNRLEYKVPFSENGFVTNRQEELNWNQRSNPMETFVAHFQNLPRVPDDLMSSSSSNGSGVAGLKNCICSSLVQTLKVPDEFVSVLMDTTCKLLVARKDLIETQAKNYLCFNN